MDKLISLIPESITPWVTFAGALWFAFTALALATASKKDDAIVSKLDKVGAFFDRVGIQLKKKK